MLTLFISIVTSIAVSTALYLTTYSYFWSIFAAVAVILGMNFFIGKYFMKKLTAEFQGVEKDLRGGRSDAAIEKLKKAYRFSKWQFFVKEQINAQIGIILYSNKRFDEAEPYLDKAFSKNWMALSMKAALEYKKGNKDQAFKVMDKNIKENKKEGFPYVFYAYLLNDSGSKEKAIEVLSKGAAKNPLDEKVESALEAVKNGKKIKMQNYGTVWMQMHMGKGAQAAGGANYQQFLMNQRVKRR